MNLKSITLKPIFEVEFTKAEVDALFIGAETHYDARCRSTTERPELRGGHILKRWEEEGLLVGLRNSLEFGGREPGQRETVKRSCVFSDIDLLAKIAESPMVPREIRLGLAALLQRFNDESEKANPKVDEDLLWFMAHGEGKAP